MFWTADSITKETHIRNFHHILEHLDFITACSGLWHEKFEREETDKHKTLSKNSISVNDILTVMKWGVILIQPRWPT